MNTNPLQEIKQVRESDASLAVIHNPDDTTEWLLKWNKRTNQYSLMGGRNSGTEDEFCCCQREVAESLKIQTNNVKPQFVTRLTEYHESPSAKEITRYYWHVIHVPISRSVLRSQCDRTGTCSKHYWATPKEINDGTTTTGDEISKQVKRVYAAYNRQFDYRKLNDYSNLLSRGRRKLIKLLRIQELSSDNAVFACDIKERKLRFRVLDKILFFLNIRDVPQECSSVYCAEWVSDLRHNDQDSEIREEWLSIYNQLHQLVRHDDQLNWNKFHYVLFIYAALFSLTGYLLVYGLFFPALLASFFGLIVAWQADLTFQEGLRCLRSHRRRISTLELVTESSQAILKRNRPNPLTSDF